MKLEEKEILRKKRVLEYAEACGEDALLRIDGDSASTRRRRIRPDHCQSSLFPQAGVFIRHNVTSLENRGVWRFRIRHIELRCDGWKSLKLGLLLGM